MTPCRAVAGWPESSVEIVRKCCSASTSVGAISIAWWPAATAVSIAARATTVLPEPTSPSSSLAIGAVCPMSSNTTSSACSCAPVRANGSEATKASAAARSDSAGASPRCCHARLRPTTLSWIASSSSKASRRRASRSRAALSG